MRAYPNLGLGYRRGSGLEELQEETLRLMAVGAIPAILGFLVLATLELEVREQPGMWLVVLGIAATALLPSRLARDRVLLAMLAFIAVLVCTVLVTLVVYPGSPMIFSLVLVSMAGATFFGLPGAVATSLIASGVTLGVTAQPTSHWSSADATPVLCLIWACGAFCWLATRPTAIALDWSWNSYVQAMEKTETLRDRQGELVRISHDLEVACQRLEDSNRELDRARREAEEARRLKSQFAAAISHELRTPLNLIIGFAEMIIRDLRTRPIVLSSERYRGDIEAIYRSACHISNLIDDVLDLSQVDAHRLALQKQRVSLAQIVEEARATLGTLCDEVGLSLRINLPSDLPPLYVDPLRIRQVLINLLNNAIRHTDEGEVAITARCDGQQVVVSVADTGSGIAPEDLPWVFEEFRQVGAVGRRQGGSGLGLAVTRRFVEMHGGSIWAESKLGEGSAFHFSLPLQEQVVAEPPTPNWSRLLGPSQGQNDRTLLVVGRDPEPARLLRRYLDGYEVADAQSLAEASRIAERAGVRAVVVAESAVDDGLEGLVPSKLAMSHLPVLTCSIRTPRQIGRELGVAAYLVKPIRREALVAALRSVGRRPRRVLVVDDDPELAGLLARMVRQAFRRCQVSRAHDGAAALDVLRAQKPDVVLLDLLMPRVDGYEVLAEMEADPELRDVPVVVVTARGVEDEAITASYLGVSRQGGLAVGEFVRCLRGCLEALLPPSSDTTSPRPTTAPPG